MLNVEEISKLKNILHMERMKANLIRISQLCDEDLSVYFNKRRCYMIKEDEECIIARIRTAENCYQMNVVMDNISMIVQIHDMELWHKRIGHVNYTLLHKLSSKEIVRGILEFKKKCRLSCGDYQVGKPTKVKHTQIGDITTTHVLELLHIDCLDQYR